jgi:hypothetical protein
MGKIGDRLELRGDDLLPGRIYESELAVPDEGVAVVGSLRSQIRRQNDRNECYSGHTISA